MQGYHTSLKTWNLYVSGKSSNFQTNEFLHIVSIGDADQFGQLIVMQQMTGALLMFTNTV